MASSERMEMDFILNERKYKSGAWWNVVLRMSSTGNCRSTVRMRNQIIFYSEDSSECLSRSRAYISMPVHQGLYSTARSLIEALSFSSSANSGVRKLISNLMLNSASQRDTQQRFSKIFQFENVWCQQ